MEVFSEEMAEEKEKVIKKILRCKQQTGNDAKSIRRIVRKLAEEYDVGEDVIWDCEIDADWRYHDS